MAPAAPSAIVITCTLALACLDSRAQPADAPVAGDWVGGFADGADWVYLQLHLEQSGDGLAGKYDLPLQFVSGRRVGDVRVDADRISFGIARGTRRWIFDGTVAGPVISGEVDLGGGRAPFRLDRLAPADTAGFSGTYRLDDGRVVHVRKWVELGLEGLLCIDSTTGRFAALFPSSGSTFFCGPSALVTYPAESVVEFVGPGDGGGYDVRWTTAGKTVRGRRVPLRLEEVAFANGDATLSGTLVLPEVGGGRRRPAVVIAPGATAAGSREMGRHFADFLALNGVATLVFDKRGTGTSGGDWLASGFEDLAGDVLAGVKALAARGDIDPARIGLLGFSQGGWVVALAASRSPDVAFIVSQSGPGVTPLEQEQYRVEHWLRADGFPEADVRDALTLLRLGYECARTDTGWDRLAELQRQSRQKAWYPYAGHTSGRDDPFWKFWGLIRDFDPVPVLEKVRCPVLAMYGDKDTYLPVDRSVAAWREALGRGGNRDVTIKVFAGADHSLLESKTGGLKESAYKMRFAPDAMPLLRDWVLARVGPGGK